MSDNPMEAAKAITPWWMLEMHRFDGLEIHPCRGQRALKTASPSEARAKDVFR